MPPKKNNPIPVEDHIIRYIPWTKLRKNEDNEVIGILGEAFKIREGEKYLSATWLEFFSDTTAAIKAIRNSNLTVKPKSGFAIGKVGSIKSKCAENGTKNLRVVYAPTDKNEGHVAVKTIPNDNEKLLDLLASETWSDLILNSDVLP